MAVVLRNPLAVGIILLISLMINLFLGGVMIGWSIQRDNYTDAFFSPKLDHPPAILQALPETKERISPILRRNGSKVHPKIRQLQRAKQEVYRQISSDSLDVTALTAALAQLRQAESEAKIAIHQVFVEVISTLTPEERQRLKQSLSRHEGPGAPAGHPPHPFLEGQPPPPFQLEKLLEERDQNRDGKLCLEEFLVPVPQQRQRRAEHHFQMLDLDKDGFITQDELESAPPPPPPGQDTF